MPFRVLNRCRMSAGSAVLQRGSFPVTYRVMVAELALIPRRVIANLRRRFGGVDNCGGAFREVLKTLFLEFDRLNIHIVIILIDADINGLLQTKNAHIYLHLHVMISF